MANVDALPTAVRLAPIGQQGNTHTQFTPGIRADERLREVSTNTACLPS
jgi:hypothetical protein